MSDMEAWLSCVALMIRTVCGFPGVRDASGFTSGLQIGFEGLWKQLLFSMASALPGSGMPDRNSSLPESRNVTWLTLIRSGRGRRDLGDGLEQTFAAGVPTDSRTVAARWPSPGFVILQA